MMIFKGQFLSSFWRSSAFQKQLAAVSASEPIRCRRGVGAQFDNWRRCEFFQARFEPRKFTLESRVGEFGWPHRNFRVHAFIFR
jgi:hypothetical protein